MSATVNIIIEQGTDFTKSYNIVNLDKTPKDLSGYTGNAQLRKSLITNYNVVFSVDITDAANGIVELSMEHEKTANIAFGRYLYDILVTSNTNTKERIIEGIVDVTPGVTY